MPKTPPSSQFESDESLETRPFFRLYKVTLPALSVVLRYIESDFSLTVDVGDGTGAQTFSAAPGIKLETELPQRIDLQVGESEVLLPNEDLTLAGLGTRKISEWAQRGVFDDAYVDVFVHDVKTQATMWHSRWFIEGNPGWTFEAIKFGLQNLWSKFDAQVPKTLIQENCNNKLYDTWCGVDPLLYQILGTVAASPAPTTLAFNFTVSSSGANVPASLPNDWLALGECKFLTGSVAPLGRMTVKQTGFQVQFGVPLPAVPTVGDQVRLRAGCNKTIDHCKNKFGTRGGVTWEKFFRGFPYSPRPDQVYMP